MMNINILNKENSKIYSMQTNLVQNSGFEISRPEGWWTWSSGILQQYIYPAPGRLGGNSVSISYPTIDVGNVAELGQTIPNITDVTKSYIFSGYMKTDISTGNGRMYISWYDINDKWLGQSSIISVTGTTNWTPYIITASPPLNCKYAEIVFKLEEIGTLWIDDVSFTDTLTPGTNLLNNSGFEIGFPTNWWTWTTGTTCTKKTGEPGRLGGYSVSLEFINPVTETCMFGHDGIIINPLVQYKVSGWMKLVNVVGTGGAAMSVEWFTSTGTFIDASFFATSRVCPGTTCDWTYYEAILNPISTLLLTAARATTILVLENCSGKVYFDDISLSTMCTDVYPNLTVT